MESKILIVDDDALTRTSLVESVARAGVEAVPAGDDGEIPGQRGYVTGRGLAVDEVGHLVAVQLRHEVDVATVTCGLGAADDRGDFVSHPVHIVVDAKAAAVFLKPRPPLRAPLLARLLDWLATAMFPRLRNARAALLAERRKARGLKLNYPEAVALISAAILAVSLAACANTPTAPTAAATSSPMPAA